MSIPIDTTVARKHFTTVDPVMVQLLDAGLDHENPIAFPTAKPTNQYFASIVSSIISQQISIHAADAVHGRVRAKLKRITPQTVLTTSDEDLRACGLSRQKISYLKKSAEIWPTLHTQNWSVMSDAEVIAELTQLYGIGQWTAEMFLMFSLARPNVFSFGDLGLMNDLYMCYPDMKPHHTRKVTNLVESWAPHRTTAALALWWHKDGGPVLL
jgi:DNA-3-methyladenine glycosylase II